MEEGERQNQMCSDQQDSCTLAPQGAVGNNNGSCREKAQGIGYLPVGHKGLLQGGSACPSVREPGDKKLAPKIRAMCPV